LGVGDFLDTTLSGILALLWALTDVSVVMILLAALLRAAGDRLAPMADLVVLGLMV
jgi:hypothetical protein